MSLLSTPGGIAAKTASRDVRAQLTSGKRDLRGRAFMLALLMALLTSVAILGVLLWDVLSTGGSVLVDRFGDFVTGSLRSQPDEAGILQGLRGTFFIGALTVVIAFPMGIAAAVYLEEYAPAQSRLARFIDVNIRNLAGVPSVVYGILGLTIFVKALGSITGPDSGGRSVLSARLTLAILVLPIVIITSAESLRAVPNGLREAGFGVGATRWEVVRTTVLPFGMSGYISGAMLGLGRALGETIALLIILRGTQTAFGWSLFDGGFTFASKIASAASEFNDQYKAGAYIAAGLVLFILTFVVNSLARAAVSGKDRSAS